MNFTLLRALLVLLLSLTIISCGKDKKKKSSKSVQGSYFIKGEEAATSTNCPDCQPGQSLDSEDKIITFMSDKTVIFRTLDKSSDEIDVSIGKYKYDGNKLKFYDFEYVYDDCEKEAMGSDEGDGDEITNVQFSQSGMTIVDEYGEYFLPRASAEQITLFMSKKQCLSIPHP